jgi:hypothetical protein
LNSYPENSTLIHDCLVGIRELVDGFWVFSLSQFFDYSDDIHPSTGADDPIDPRDLLSNFESIALSQTTRGDQVLVVAFLGCQFSQHLQGFIFGWANESTGINN